MWNRLPHLFSHSLFFRPSLLLCHSFPFLFFPSLSMFSSFLLLTRLIQTNLSQPPIWAPVSLHEIRVTAASPVNGKRVSVRCKCTVQVRLSHLLGRGFFFFFSFLNLSNAIAGKVSLHMCYAWDKTMYRLLSSPVSPWWWWWFFFLVFFLLLTLRWDSLSYPLIRLKLTCLLAAQHPPLEAFFKCVCECTVWSDMCV